MLLLKNYFLIRRKYLYLLVITPPVMGAKIPKIRMIRAVKRPSLCFHNIPRAMDAATKWTNTEESNAHIKILYHISERLIELNKYITNAKLLLWKQFITLIKKCFKHRYYSIGYMLYIESLVYRLCIVILKWNIFQHDFLKI